jgi:hypothetical protein
MPSVPLVAVAVLSALPLCAQAVWKLPPSGAAEFRRTHTLSSDVADSKAAAELLTPKGQPPDGLLLHLVPSPWLCQGELTADQRAVGDEPRDLRDVIRAVAFDLRLDGAVRLRYRRQVPFGDLVFAGKVEAPAADGAQTFTLAVTTEDPELRPGESRAALQQFIRPLCKHAAGGSLRMSRTFDAQRGVVAKFDAELTLVFEEAKGKWRKLVVADAQEFVALHDNQDAAFRGRVATAIRDGGKWLKKEVEDLSRRHFQDQEDGERSYGAGRIALALLTMLHAEIPPDDPVVAAGFDELRRRTFVDTYSLAVALMALAERHTPPGEADLLRSGTLKAPRQRVLPEADKAVAVEWLAKLRANIDTRGNANSRMAFNYTAGPRFDNSVHQYGMLGLYAASLCGLEVPVTVWRATANYQLDVQCLDHGRQLPPGVTSYRELAAAADASDGAKPTRAMPRAVPVRGFAYHTPNRPPYGSMTAAGVGSLVIARFGLLQSGQPHADVAPKIEAGIQSGFAWLGAEFHVRSNPGYVDRADDSWYYYLYGLERTCELYGIARIAGRDWYYEGALQILPLQNKSGSFRSERARGLMLDATCFAVLFLKKAALPPVTGG